MKNRICLFLSFILLVLPLASAQTGGSYDLSHSVVASGGGSNSSGGTFRVDGTVGQAVAGTVSTGTSPTNNLYSVRGGFWAFNAFAPTAATVGLRGRVFSGKGLGIIRRVKIVLLDVSTNIERTTQTDSSGDYQFDELEINRFYIVRAESRIFNFTPDSYFLELIEDRADVNFTGINTLK